MKGKITPRLEQYIAQKCGGQYRPRRRATTRAVARRFARHVAAALCGITLATALAYGFGWLAATGIRAVFRWLGITLDMALVAVFAVLLCALPLLILGMLADVLRDTWRSSRGEVEGEEPC